MSIQGLDAAIETVGFDTVEAANEAGLRLMHLIQDATPVKTGKLKAGWKMKPITEVGDMVEVTNNVEYAIYVNDGTHKMAPRLMVEKGIAKFNSEFRSVSRRI